MERMLPMAQTRCVQNQTSGWLLPIGCSIWERPTLSPESVPDDPIQAEA